MLLHVNPEGLAGTSAAIEAVVADLFSAHCIAQGPIASLIPPGLDGVSITSVSRLYGFSASHHTITGEGINNCMRSGIGVGLSSSDYLVADCINAANLGFGVS